MSDNELKQIHSELCRIGRDVQKTLTVIEGYKQDIEKILLVKDIEKRAEEYSRMQDNTEKHITF